MIIGVTGSIGSGKSTVSQLLEKYGMYIIDCDKISHSIDDIPEYKNTIKEVFGCDVFDGEKIDRKKLASFVFENKEKVKLLESISFPIIINEIHKKKDISIKNKKICVYDAPTLFNAGLDKECDFVIGVIAEKHVRIERAKQRGTLTEEEILKRVMIQPDDKYYIDRCDFIIDNSGTLDELEIQLNSIIKKLKKEVSYGN